MALLIWRSLHSFVYGMVCYTMDLVCVHILNHAITSPWLNFFGDHVTYNDFQK
jgi:hypothetical protein